MGRKTEKLSAEISVEDKASKKLDNITKSMTKQNNELLRLKAQMEKVRAESRKKNEFKVETKSAVREVGQLTRAFQRLNTEGKRAISSLGSAMGGLGRLMPSPSSLLYGGVAATAGAGYFGKKIFDRTIGAAAQYEVSEKSIQSMFGNDKASQAYLNFIESKALDSPLLNSKDMFNNSGMFVSKTQDQKQLEKIWDLAERLTARNPDTSRGGGLEGAAFALSEAFSGDLVSMKDRFNINTKELKGIGKLDTDKQIALLDKFFNKNKMTQQLVKDMGSTTLGTWNQIGEASESALKKMGEPANKVIGDYLKEINKLTDSNQKTKFIEHGQKIFKGLAEGFVSGSKSAGDWIDRIANDPAFQEKKGLLGKVEFVFGDIYQSFQGWLQNGGRDKISTVTSDIISTMAEAVAKSEGPIIEVGASIGAAIGKGIVQGTKNHLKDKFLNLDFGPVGFGQDIIDKYFGGYIENSKDIWGIGDGKVKPEEKQGYTPTYKYADQAKGQKKAFGMQRIPYNNFPILAHEGEKLLTKQQANQQKQGVQVRVSGNTFVVREEADINKIVSALVRKLEEGRTVFGGAS
jgi:hypothetical protein